MSCSLMSTEVKAWRCCEMPRIYKEALIIAEVTGAAHNPSSAWLGPKAIPSLGFYHSGHDHSMLPQTHSIAHPGHTQPCPRSGSELRRQKTQWLSPGPMAPK